MKNPLDPIMDGYEVSLDSIRVILRIIGQRIPNAITRKHTFYNEAEAAGLGRIERAKAQLDDLTVLGLVSTFERSLRDALAALPRIANAPPAGDPVDARVRGLILEDLEYWKLSEEVLAIFATRGRPNVIGRVKQSIDYRNWVAHGRSAAPRVGRGAAQIRLPIFDRVPRPGGAALIERV